MIALPRELEEKQRLIAGRNTALNAAIAIAQMDPHSLEDLRCYLTALADARLAGEEQEIAYIVESIAEVFEPTADGDAPGLDDWNSDVQKTTEGRSAADRRQAENVAFIARYRDLKAARGFKTIRQVADASGLSPTTVQAIETQRVKPQDRTLQALAKAFGVTVSELGGH